MILSGIMLNHFHRNNGFSSVILLKIRSADISSKLITFIYSHTNIFHDTKIVRLFSVIYKILTSMADKQMINQSFYTKDERCNISIHKKKT